MPPTPTADTSLSWLPSNRNQRMSTTSDLGSPASDDLKRSISSEFTPRLSTGGPTGSLQFSDSGSDNDDFGAITSKITENISKMDVSCIFVSFDINHLIYHLTICLILISNLEGQGYNICQRLKHMQSVLIQLY